MWFASIWDSKAGIWATCHSLLNFITFQFPAWVIFALVWLFLIHLIAVDGVHFSLDDLFILLSCTLETFSSHGFQLIVCFADILVFLRSPLSFCELNSYLRSFQVLEWTNKFILLIFFKATLKYFCLCEHSFCILLHSALILAHPAIL